MSAGIDVRQAIQDAGGTKVTQMIVEVYLADSSGDIVTTGTTQLELLELQADGTLEVYDFDAGVRAFVASSPTDRDLAMTHQQAAGSNTGLWTAVLDQHAVNAMTLRGIYYLRVTNTGASPKTQIRKMQFGDMEGDGFAFAQIATVDGLTAFDASIEANSITRSQDVQDAITLLSGVVDQLADAAFLHRSTITAVTGSVGATTTITVADPMSNAATAEAGRLVLIVPTAGSPYLRVSNVSTWQLSGDVVTLEATSASNPNVGDVVYFLPASTKDMDAATLRAALGLAAANLDTQLLELPKIPRAASALTAGAAFTRTKTGETSTTLTESLG